MQRHFCSQCGGPIDETIRFCGGCGKEVLNLSTASTETAPSPASPSNPPPPATYAPQQQPVPDYAPPSYRPAPAYAAPAVQKNNTPIIIAAIIGGTVIVLAILLIVLIIGLRNKEQPKADNSTLNRTPVMQQDIPKADDLPQSSIVTNPTAADLAGWWQSEMTLYDVTTTQQAEVVWVKMRIEVVPVDDTTVNLILHPMEGREEGAPVEPSYFEGETETLPATFEKGGLSMVLPYEQPVYFFMPIAPQNGTLYGSGEAYFGDETYQAKGVMNMLKE